MLCTFYLNSALASAASLSRNASISPSRGEKAPTSAAAFRADSISILLLLFLHTCSGKMSIPTKVSRAHLQNCREGNLTRNFWYGKNTRLKIIRKKYGEWIVFKPVFLLHFPNSFLFFLQKKKSFRDVFCENKTFFQPQTRRADGTWRKHGMFSPEKKFFPRKTKFGVSNTFEE